MRDQKRKLSNSPPYTEYLGMHLICLSCVLILLLHNITDIEDSQKYLQDIPHGWYVAKRVKQKETILQFAMLLAKPENNCPFSNHFSARISFLFMFLQNKIQPKDQNKGNLPPKTQRINPPGPQKTQPTHPRVGRDVEARFLPRTCLAKPGSCFMG